ncbi:hypothetical protein ACLB1G_21535 [Oxalobacteraceae bacterium A2-2]
MKHLRLFPFVIAAAYYLPRAAHAAELSATAQGEPGGYGVILAVAGLISLAVRRRRNERFKMASEL